MLLGLFLLWTCDTPSVAAFHCLVFCRFCFANYMYLVIRLHGGATFRALVGLKADKLFNILNLLLYFGALLPIFNYLMPLAIC